MQLHIKAGFAVQIALDRLFSAEFAHQWALTYINASPRPNLELHTPFNGPDIIQIS